MQQAIVVGNPPENRIEAAVGNGTSLLENGHTAKGLPLPCGRPAQGSGSRSAVAASGNAMLKRGRGHGGSRRHAGGAALLLAAGTLVRRRGDGEPPGDRRRRANPWPVLPEAFMSDPARHVDDRQSGFSFCQFGRSPHPDQEMLRRETRAPQPSDRPAECRVPRRRACERFPCLNSPSRPTVTSAPPTSSAWDTYAPAVLLHEEHQSPGRHVEPCGPGCGRRLAPR